MLTDGLFILFTVFAVTGAAGLVLFKHPMNGAMSFLVTLISLAGLYALLSAKLIFAIQLMVYAGAIMSFIIFVIMFLNIQEEDLPIEEGRFKYLIGGVIIVAPIGLFLSRVIKSFPGADAIITVEGFGEIKEVGLLLFREWLLRFEIVSILLLVSLVGAVVLAGTRRIAK